MKYILSIAIITLFLFSCTTENKKNDGTESNKPAAISLDTTVEKPSQGQVLNTADFARGIENNKKYQLIDIRTPEEFKTGMVGVAINIDYNSPDFEEKISRLPKDIPCYIYCQSGKRSAGAAEIMRKNGLTVYELEGGMNKWETRRPIAH